MRVAGAGGVDRASRPARDVERLGAGRRQPAAARPGPDHHQRTVGQPPGQPGHGLRRVLAAGQRGRLTGAQAQKVGPAQHPRQPPGRDVGDQRAGVHDHQPVFGKSRQPPPERPAGDRVDQVVAGDVHGVAGTERQRAQVVRLQAGLRPRRGHERALPVRLHQPDHKPRVRPLVGRQQRRDPGQLERVARPRAEHARAGAAAVGRRHAEPRRGHQHVEAPAGAGHRLARQQVAAAVRQPVDVQEHVHDDAADQDEPARPHPYACHAGRHATRGRCDRRVQ